MKRLFQNRRVRLLFVLAVLLQVGTFMLLRGATQQSGLDLTTLGDSNDYKLLTEHLACCSVFSTTAQAPFIPNSVRTPGYPLLLAPFYILFERWWVILFFQGILLSFAPIILYAALRHIDERTAFFAALLFCLDPVRLFMSALLLTDAPFTFVLLLTTLFFVLWIRKSKMSWLAASGATLGFAMLVRPIAFYAWVVFVIVLVAQANIIHWRKWLRSTGVFLAFLLVVAAPWSLRNFRLFGTIEFTPLGAYSLATANTVQFIHDKTGRPLSEIRDELNARIPSSATDEQLVSFALAPIYTSFARDVIGSDLIGYTMYHSVKTIPLLLTDGLRFLVDTYLYPVGAPTPPNLSSAFLQGRFLYELRDYAVHVPLHFVLLIIGSTFWSLVTVGFLLSFLFTWSDRKYRLEWLLVYLLVAYFVVLSSGPVAQARYRLPFEGLFIFAGLRGWIGCRTYILKMKQEKFNQNKHENGTKGILIVTQAVDANDTNLAFFLRWLAELAARVSVVHVAAWKVGEHGLPANVHVHRMPKGKWRRMFALMRLSISIRKDVQAVFVHMLAPVAAVLGWFWRVLGLRVVLWYTHGAVPMSLRVANVQVNAICTATDESLRLRTIKKIVTGHGIDTDYFCPGDEPRLPEMITVGRNSPRKHLESLLDLADVIRKTHPTLPFRLRIIGEAYLDSDLAYVERLKAQIGQRGLQEIVTLEGSKLGDDLLAAYQRSAVFVTASATGSLDKVVIESLSCGTPVLAASPVFAGFKGVHVAESGWDAEAVAFAVSRLTRPVTDPEARTDVVAKASLKGLISRLVSVLLD